MRFCRAILLLLACVALSACINTGTRSRPPTVKLEGVNYSEERLRASDLRYFSAPYEEPAGTPTTILTIADNDLSGFIRVRKARHAGGGEFAVPMAVNAGAYFVARKARKHFKWGDVESCLAQFTNENGGYAPNSDHLAYQASGMTTGGRYTVFFSFAVGHPRLPTSAKAQFYKGRDLDRVAERPHMQLIEHAPDAEFQPSIRRIDDMINGLIIHE